MRDSSRECEVRGRKFGERASSPDAPPNRGRGLLEVTGYEFARKRMGRCS